MKEEDFIQIVKKRIKYLKQSMNLTRKNILNAQSNKDFKSAIGNMRSYDNESYALFELEKLEEELKQEENKNA